MAVARFRRNIGSPQQYGALLALAMGVFPSALRAATTHTISHTAVPGQRMASYAQPRSPSDTFYMAWAPSIELVPIDSVVSLFRHPERERVANWMTVWTGRYGPTQWLIPPLLSWSADSCEDGDTQPWFSDEQRLAGRLGVSNQYSFLPSPMATFLDVSPIDDESNTLDVFLSLNAEQQLSSRRDSTTFSSASTHCPPWYKPHTVTIARYGGEHDRVTLLECDGSVSSDTLDRLSILARPPLRAKPELPLPIEPQGAGDKSEWLPQLKLLHPRLAWILHRLATTFPRHMIYFVSGYRPEARAESLHRQGRALDLFVQGVTNESVFRFCRSQRHVGCGYYPHHQFVHIDVRSPSNPSAYWIDTSNPGEPSNYVDSWPGVVEAGALRWAGAE